MTTTADGARPAWPFDTDDETLGLMFSLLREDAMGAVSASNGKGKRVQGVLPDAEYALRLQTQELDQAMTYLSDRRTTRSMQSAVQVDSNVLEAERETGPSAAELELLEMLKTTYVDDEIIRRHWRQCSACNEAIDPKDLARAPCNHEYCRECLEQLFRSAMLDESMFPPRCCRQGIPADRSFLGNDLVRQYEEKAVEFSTPNRTYCHQPTCSTFILPRWITAGVAHCPNCVARTCTICKGGAHPGDCPFDRELQRVLQIARQEGWRRCPDCATMIELNMGCFHMTCKCKAQFCYLCGERWKTCSCAQWEEGRLYDRAQEVYNRDHNPANEVHDRDHNPADQAVAFIGGGIFEAPPAAEDDATRQDDVGRIMENLRQNHECNHDLWRNRSGNHQCEECGDRMRLFIYECRQCSILACRRCRYHRL